MVRTTLNLDPSVLSELKRRAKKHNRPLGDIASEELAEKFKVERVQRNWPPEGWVVHSMGEFAVDLDDKEALLEFFDRESGLVS
ncbi:MAG: hypothetical protein ABI577_15685 [bacterium]